MHPIHRRFFLVFFFLLSALGGLFLNLSIGLEETRERVEEVQKAVDLVTAVQEQDAVDNCSHV